MRHKGKIGKDIDHPAVFPVALPEFVIEAYTDAGDLVFEPFGGSGTTMLAAQRTGRNLPQLVEIAPQYVDVALHPISNRTFPGVPVTLAATAEPFETVAQQRKAEHRQESESCNCPHTFELSRSGLVSETAARRGIANEPTPRGHREPASAVSIGTAAPARETGRTGGDHLRLSLRQR
jgi:hypothetical protein